MNCLISKVAPTLTSWAPTRCFSTSSSVAPLFRLHSVQPTGDKSKVASLQTDSTSFSEFALDSNNDVYEVCYLISLLHYAFASALKPNREITSVFCDNFIAKTINIHLTTFETITLSPFSPFFSR